MSTENNKLIAEFMGQTYECPKIDGSIPFGEYHSSWDWLMPVVEKIDNHKHPMLIASNNCCIYETKDTPNDKGFMIDIYADTKIEATYQAIIRFIKWYNKQEK